MAEGWIVSDGGGFLAQARDAAGTLAPGASLVLTSSNGLGPLKLPNDGGLLKLLSDRGEQVDHVDYTTRDLRSARGRPLIFATYRRE